MGAIETTPNTVSSSTVYYGDDFIPPQGYVGWTNISNVFSYNGAFTTVTFAESAGTSQASQNLLVYNFDTWVPGNATITGVYVSIVASSTGVYGTYLDHIRMVIGGNITALNKETNVPEFTGTLTYGGAGDLWGNTLTPAIINSSDFGFVLGVVPIVVASTQKASTGSVDVVILGVEYTTPPSVKNGQFLQFFT